MLHQKRPNLGQETVNITVWNYMVARLLLFYWCQWNLPGVSYFAAAQKMDWNDLGWLLISLNIISEAGQYVIVLQVLSKDKWLVRNS